MFKNLLKSPVQIFFGLLAIVALVGVGPFTYYSYKFSVKSIEKKPEGYEYPDWRDFKWSLLSVAVIGILDALLYNIFLKLFRPYCKE